jgi:hypothetical protein
MEAMPSQTQSLFGQRVFEVADDGHGIHSIRYAVDVVGMALGQDATMVVLPIASLDPAFFQLSTRFAGEVLQKFVNYGLRVVVLGDHSQHSAQSGPLRDFIRESNRSKAIWFLADWNALKEKLAAESEGR